MNIKSQGHSLILVKGHSDFKVKCLTLGLYTQVSDSGPQGPLVHCLSEKIRLYVASESCARQKIHMKIKPYFLGKIIVKIKMPSAAIFVWRFKG